MAGAASTILTSMHVRAIHPFACGGHPFLLLLRRAAPYGLSTLAVGAGTAALLPVRPRLHAANASMAFLLIVLFTAVRGGIYPALFASLVATLALNFFFTIPYYSLAVSSPGDLLALGLFVVTSVSVGQLSTRAARRAEEAERRRHQVERLYSELQRENSERRHAEEEARRLNVELEERVRQRTAQLELANKELESFSYSVSHDLRAPLRHISGFVNLLQKRAAASLDDGGRRYLGIIFEAVQHMDQLITDLLAFSRMGRTDLKDAPVELEALVRGAIGDLAAEARGRAVEWEVGPLPVVRADREMLKLVLANLLGNALKFTVSRGRTLVQIGCERTPREEIVRVRDNGVGFDMRYGDKLFGVFQRLHDARDYPGTGIGLATVRRIVTRHGGRTWAEGRVGEGATFYFSLPRQGAS